MPAHLEAIGLIKQFGGTRAVDGVDLQATAGEFLSLLGPSGCGKTTTLRLVAGLESPDAGRILIDGQDVTAIPAQRRGLGMVFQQYALFPNMSAWENVAFSLRLRRMPKAEIARRVDDLLALVHLEEAAQRYPHQLSGGMQQRVALARALAMEPPLLLLDEPLSALDAAIRDELRGELRRIQKRLGLTVIYVTHDQSEAMALSDRIVVMDKGIVSQIGTPQEIYNRPSNRFAAGFVGSSNRCDTVVEMIEGKPAIRWGNDHLTVNDAQTRIGERVSAVWRPESAMLATKPARGASLQGEIELATFMGPLTRFDIRLPASETPVFVDLVSETAQLYDIGQRVAVVLPRDALRLYPIS
jgi:putative spermidine/putrescine transport system ATP-binding protein